MSLIFFCSSEGCYIEEVDDEIFKKASLLTKTWASEIYSKCGIFPFAEERAKYFQKKYDELEKKDG